MPSDLRDPGQHRGIAPEEQHTVGVFRDTRIMLHGEGNRVAGFGSISGACDTRVESGDIRGELLAGERLLLGNANSRFIVTGGNFQIFSDVSARPVSPAGQPLFFLNPKDPEWQ